jgi:hypothetical protein
MPGPLPEVPHVGGSVRAQGAGEADDSIMESARLHAFGAIKHLLADRGGFFGFAPFSEDMRKSGQAVRLPA